MRRESRPGDNNGMVRRAPITELTVIAAARRPLPLTSPTTTRMPPSSPGRR